ncbi:calcium/sodium antiporter [Sinomicrobium weinanense]|uniref:Calcium/sodium antiporter n=1 Tax=Sinomicrobium weinanense TaxID=2842200 RepID=A0A926JR60_9FLAO|nr:calcium/sodium antiporter [Sinomicrobium weinanense]MBC9795794.1 calcium/sodium antiporter [Sinomicrobium weinanense]MBU3121838.1 calcium/sodium antiporter [Sinomicrobium weinanense]
MDDFIVLIAGISGLWGGTEIVVRNALVLAKKYNVSELFIGLTILAFGTDLPELVVAIDGAFYNLKGVNVSGVIVGNAIGSSVCQISIVMGLTAFFHFLKVEKKQVRYMAIELIGSLLLLLLLAFDHTITWNDGALMIVVFLIYIFTRLQREPKQLQAEFKIDKKRSLNDVLPVIFLVLGLGLVIFSSDITIKHALNIAQIWEVRQSFVGAVIIGLGSSLPELAVSVNAAIKKKPGLSIGNIIGSNIFDLLIPLGMASLVADIRVIKETLWFDIPFLLLISISVLWFLDEKRGLKRSQGIILLCSYVLYAVIKYLFSDPG